MAIDKEECKQCIWMDDETGICEAEIATHGFLEMSPFYKTHPEIKPLLLLGIDPDNDCVGMERRPAFQRGRGNYKTEFANAEV